MEYRERPPSDDAFGELRTYATECDPVAQARYEAGGTGALERKLKLLSLLNESVTVAGTHAVGSETTFSVLREHPRLLTCGAVVPAINAEFDSLLDMVDRKVNRTGYSHPWNEQLEYADPDALERRAKFLDQHASQVMVWDIESMRGSFRESLLNRLSDPNSPLYGRLRDVTDVEDVRTKVDRLDVVSRQSLERMTTDLPRQAREILIDYANVDYHTTGASVHRAVPNVQQAELETFRARFAHALDAIETDIRPPGQDAAFDEYLDVLGLRKDGLDNLEGDQIASLRGQRVTRRFRGELLDALRSVGKGTSPSADWTDAREELRTELKNRRQNERRRTKGAKQVVELCVYLGGLAVALSGDIEAGVAAAALDPVLERLCEASETLVGNDLHAFSERYRDATEP